MIITHFDTSATTLSTQDNLPVIIAGNAGTHGIQFTFTDDIWDTLTATATFRASAPYKGEFAAISIAIMDKDATYVVPPEVMAVAGASIQLELLGLDRNGAVVLPTLCTTYATQVNAGAASNVVDHSNRTPSVYEQWLRRLDECTEAATAEANASAVEASEQAIAATESARTATAQASAAATSAAAATASASNASESLTATKAYNATATDAVQAIANNAAAIALTPPYIGTNGNWYVWDRDSDTYHNSGTPAQGAAFTYADFTAAQLTALKGETGETGATGATGAQGAAFTYADFTTAQLAALKGETGETGKTGATGATGAQGAAFTYADFTAAQLAALKGETGADGADGTNGADGVNGADGADGTDGTDGYTPIRGTDYWTSTDKAEIVADVADAFGVLFDDVNGEVV